KTNGTHGLATLSRFPILKNITLELPKYVISFRHQPRIALISTIEFETKLITVANIHLDARLNQKHRINQLDFALQQLKSSFGPNIILAGDLNTIPFFL